MISFISRFKIYLALAAVIVPIEYFVFVKTVPPGKYPTNFLEFAYLKPESMQKFVIYEKNRNFEKVDADLVSVGDSSGLFGLQPLIAMEYLDGKEMINLNVAADTGFEGYRHLLEYYAKHHPSARYAVLYISPLQMPIIYGSRNKLSRLIYENYVGPSRYLNFPNASARLRITNYLYYGVPSDLLFNFYHPMAGDYPTYAEWEKELTLWRGWLPFPKTSGLEVSWDEKDLVGECDLTLDGKHDLTFKSELEKFVALTDRLGMRAAVLFNPVPCSIITGSGSDTVQTQLDSFSAKHPSVYIPWDLITTWSGVRFGDSLHFTPEASTDNSRRVGKALKRWLNDDGVSYYHDHFASPAPTRKNILNGTMNAYDESGHLVSEREYRDGKLDGVSRTYHENGQISSERSYVKGKLEGVCKKYYPDGTLEWENYFHKGAQSGWSKAYFQNGVLKSLSQYDQNLRNGSFILYGDGGMVRVRANYRDGKLDGLVTLYFPDGKKEAELLYRKGLQHGLSKYYYPNGRLKEEINCYKGGAGDFRRGYYESGTLFQEVLFSRNSVKRVVRTYSEAGSLASEEVFEFGKRIEQKTFDNQ